MANFEIDNAMAQMITELNSFANNEEIYKNMISEGQNIMKAEIESRARKHIKTGRMASSIKATKPVKNKNDEWVGRIKFTGTDGKYVTKDGKKYDITNWLKAFRIEYGTSFQKAEPFVRPAVESCRNDINRKWKEMHDKELEKLK